MGIEKVLKCDRKSEIIRTVGAGDPAVKTSREPDFKVVHKGRTIVYKFTCATCDRVIRNALDTIEMKRKAKPAPAGAAPPLESPPGKGGDDDGSETEKGVASGANPKPTPGAGS